MASAPAMAADLLDRVAAFFATAGVALPAVRYVAPGNSTTVAFDEDSDGPRECVMAVIDWTGDGQPGADRNFVPDMVFWQTHYAQFSVLIVRRAAVQDDQSGPPTPAQIGTDAVTNLADLSTLHRALGHIRDTAKEPGGWAPMGSPVAVGRTQTVGPQGAVMAVVGQIQAAVDL